MVNTSELLLNVVMHQQAKGAGLEPKGKWLRSKAPISLDADNKAIGE